MMPYTFGLPTYFLSWGAATVIGLAVAVRLTTEAGFPRRRAVAAILLVAASIVVGSKLMHIAETALFPFDDQTVVPGQQLGAKHGFRIPGGIALSLLALPLICRALGFSALRFADAMVPAIGVAIVFLRLGCFANGCCFGAVCDLPWAVSFPSRTPVHWWQLNHGLIAGARPTTLPVHPLQLYFAAVGAAMYIAGRYWQRQDRPPGFTWLMCVLIFFAGSLAVETLRAYPLRLNLAFASAMTVGLGIAVVGVLRRDTGHGVTG